MRPNKANVTVVQLATPNIDTFAIYSMLSVNHYCNMHGYQHVVQRTKSVEDMHINWSKIDLLKKAFEFVPENEYVLLTDADIVINDYTKSVDYFLNKFGKEDTEIMMPQDTPLKLTLAPRPNAGFVLVRNSNRGRQLVEDWISASRGEGAHLNDIHPRNQLVYWNYVMPKYLSTQVLLPRWYFQKPLFVFGENIMASKFIYHITQSNADDRAKTMKKMLERNIPVSKSTISHMKSLLSQQRDYIALDLSKQPQTKELIPG